MRIGAALDPDHTCIDFLGAVEEVEPATRVIGFGAPRTEPQSMAVAARLRART